MSETFLQEIADQLRDQNPPAETVQQPAAQTETVVEETPQVETSEPKVEVQSEEPAWYEKEEKVVQTEQKLEEKSLLPKTTKSILSRALFIKSGII